MSRRVRRGKGVEVWRFPALGFTAAAAAAAVPGSPVGPEGWPVRGAFGVFTWAAWFASAGLAVTLLLLAAALAARRGRAARGVVLGRVLPAALTFGLLAVAAFAAAARADRIERSPAVALAVAVAGLVALRAVAARIAGAGGGNSDVAN
jgi:hypothetical protein